jgi:Domain of unknown function (DUF5069)
MFHYVFPQTFQKLYAQALHNYAEGRRSSDSFFDAEQTAWLTANGLSAQVLYDYVEDFNSGGEPSYDQALQIETIRRDYFFNEQQGQPSTTVADPSKWPAKTEAINGIEWLPRILPKVRAKLRGELPTTLMYSCGGDRRFFKANDILPAEFLSLAWRFEGNDAAVIAWVIARASSTRQE